MESIVSSGSKVSIVMVGGVVSVYKKIDADANDNRNIQRYCTTNGVSCVAAYAEIKKTSDQPDIADSVDEL